MIESTRNTQKVWDALSSETTGIPVQDLCNQLTMTFDEVMTAVRMIAREHNIGLANKNGNLMVIGVHVN